MKHLKGLHKSPLTYFIIIVLALALELGFRGSTPLAEYLFWIIIIYFNVAILIGSYIKTNKKRMLTIKKGKKYIFHFPQIALFKEKREISFRIRKNSWYDPEVHGHHIHKIKGNSFGLWTSHHNNSIRLGFSPSKKEGSFFIYTYIYNNGVRITNEIAQIREMQKLSIEEVRDLKKNMVSFKEGGKVISKQPFEFPKDLTGWELFPYYEGKDDKPAPNDITIEFFNKN